MSSFVVGQRFLSEAEPELGLGQVERIENRPVFLRFPANDTTRQYISFALVNEPCCEAQKASEPDENPFSQSQTAIVSLDWLLAAGQA